MRSQKSILLVVSLFLFSCGKDDTVGSNPEVLSKENNGTFLQEINTEPLVQYTPNLSPWERIIDGPLQDYEAYNDNKGYKYNSHKGYESNALKDIPLMTEEDWENNYWDGKPFNPEKLTRVELHQALFPRHGIMRGLKQLYERHKPFKDERKPTKAEVDEWNRLVINHFRALCGYGDEKYKVKNSHALYIMSLWSDEVKFTDKWDGDPYRDGKTVIQDKNSWDDYLKRAHYGFGFVPPEGKQKPYYPSGVTPTIFKGNTAEGISAVRQWAAWSTKLSIVLGNMLKTEGFWGGHLGPLWHREKIGISYYKPLIDADADKRITVQVRLLYHGELRKPLYTDPDGDGKVY